MTIAGWSPERLAAAQRALGEVRTVVANIADKAAAQEIFQGINRVDHVVISAGTLGNGRLVQNDMATLRRIVDKRIFGAVHVVRQAAPRMQQGSIPCTSAACRPGHALARRCSQPCWPR